jgi:hypothetical protein
MTQAIGVSAPSLRSLTCACGNLTHALADCTSCLTTRLHAVKTLARQGSATCARLMSTLPCSCCVKSRATRNRACSAGSLPDATPARLLLLDSRGSHALYTHALHVGTAMERTQVTTKCYARPRTRTAGHIKQEGALGYPRFERLPVTCTQTGIHARVAA